MKRVVYFLIASAIWISVVNSVSYEGYKAYRLWTANKEDYNILIHFVNNKHFDFWSPPNANNKSIDVMVQPFVQYKFECLLEDRQISYKVLIENVGSIIRKQKQFYKAKPKLEGAITFDRYWRHDDINKYLEYLAKNYSGTVKVETIGQSHEKRHMKIVRVSAGKSSSNPVIFIDGGIHAREWIAPAVALYIIQQLVEHPENSNLIENVDWIILPSINPDGYEYTWTDDRFWRKTRTLQADNCTGVDANRNFGYGWGKRGSSNDPCSDTYAGPAAFSEVETRNVRDLLSNTSNVALYVTLHSYSQVIIYPWGFTEELPEDVDELEEVGKVVSAAIEKVNGTKYEVGDTWRVMYPAAGTSHDWAKGGANVSLSYTIELPGGGEEGYDLSEDRILGVVTETFEGFKAFHGAIEKKFGHRE